MNSLSPNVLEGPYNLTLALTFSFAQAFLHKLVIHLLKERLESTVKSISRIESKI